jgi:hypothetical protein
MSHAPEFEAPPGGISKRAAQRLIQRALVIANRNRSVRQHIRETDLTSVWVIEDWGLEWAVIIRRGELEFDRRVPKRPDIKILWPSAEAFFKQSEPHGEGCGGAASRYEGPPGARRAWDVVYRAFQEALRGLLQDPVDGDGRSLL